MAFDFPNAPTVGQTYPQPPVVGVPVYTWCLLRCGAAQHGLKNP
jgi:hypothetical protein